ncbi:hypothetical protein FRB90_005689 [Tulasnella sp. 427]|nr:hypothetical protein FRB90_005689 [Tulasnella sp. 427]
MSLNGAIYKTQNERPLVEGENDFNVIDTMAIGALGDSPATNMILTAFRSAPTRRGQVHVMSAMINWPQSEVSVAYIAQWIKRTLITPFRVTGGSAPLTEKGINPFKDPLGYWGGDVVSAAANRTQDTLRGKVMTRDNNQCIITKRKDPTEAASDGEGPRRVETVVAAHILPFSLCQYQSKKEDPDIRSARLQGYWTSLQAFSGISLEQFTGANINTVSNAMVLCSTYVTCSIRTMNSLNSIPSSPPDSVHTYYDRLELALKPIFPDEGPINPDEYECQLFAYGPAARYVLYDEFDFDANNNWGVSIATRTVQVTGKDNLPAPSPYCLALHWAASYMYYQSNSETRVKTALLGVEVLSKEAVTGTDTVSDDVESPVAYNGLANIVEQAYEGAGVSPYSEQLDDALNEISNNPDNPQVVQYVRNQFKALNHN